LFHEHDISSSGAIAQNTGKSSSVSWEARSSGLKWVGSNLEDREESSSIVAAVAVLGKGEAGESDNCAKAVFLDRDP
jgi:hypothetical protein